MPLSSPTPLQTPHPSTAPCFSGAPRTQGLRLSGAESQGPGFRSLQILHFRSDNGAWPAPTCAALRTRPLPERSSQSSRLRSLLGDPGPGLLTFRSVPILQGKTALLQKLTDGWRSPPEAGGVRLPPSRIQPVPACPSALPILWHAYPTAQHPTDPQCQLLASLSLSARPRFLSSPKTQVPANHSG